ncbi:MAG TPA: hypothetical protein VMU88_02055, partial [bacterium]|nr:hypothetical protein [bacterium]
GDSRDAFLSDTAVPPSFHTVFLGSNAETVIYSQSGAGGWKITVTYTDGSVKSFDEDGHRL